MAEKKTVLMVHNFYQIGGGEHTVFENEEKLLREHGHKVVCYTRSNDELKTGKWKLLLLPFSTIWSFKTYVTVRKIIKENAIDVVHCHNTFPLISPSVYYAARSRKVPVVQTIHNFRFLCPNGVFFRDGHICEDCRTCGSFKPALQHKCYRNSVIQTAVTVAMLKFHRAIGTYNKISYIFLTNFNRRKFEKFIDVDAGNIFIKPNFVCLPKIIPKDSDSGQNVFVFAGRLEENKGVDFLLNAWKEMPEDYELHIFGDGTLKPAVEAAARSQCNIKYYGFASQNVIFEKLAQAKALIFPSKLYETFGMTIAESFALGVPAVAADVGNHADMVRASGAGTLFEIGNIGSFRLAVENVICHNARYAEKAKAYYKDNLSADENYRCLIQIYDALAM